MEGDGEDGESDHQVFINHSGPDAKKNLASPLYHALKRAGLRVFLDQKELQTGESVTPAIIEAINSSSVYIAIFSPNYAHSRWCMEELCLMLQNRNNRTIIPIFCDVEPWHLRHLVKGPFKEDFDNHKHNGSVNKEVVEEWEKALKEASEIKGHLFNAEKSDQREFVNRIVHIVVDKVKGEPLVVAEYPVGLDKAAEDFQKEILIKREVTATTVVGIVGLGGSGKSTLVAHLYNLLNRSQFRKCAFLSDVSNRDLLDLQQHLIRDLIGNYNCQIKDIREGRSLLLSRLRELRQDPVLIVLDDIDESEKTESLFSVKDALPQGSLILVTSSDKDLVLRFAMSSDQNKLQVKLYDIKLLDGKDARQLFCRYAFSLSKPREGFEDLVERFVKICDGFPLALKVLGRQVYGKLDQRFWERQLDKLQRGQVPGAIVERVLNLSYRSLDSTEKEIFLDIAHFFVGEDKDLVEKVLEGLDFSGSDCLTTLHHKCLVEFENVEVDSSYSKYMDKWKWRTEHWRRRKGSSKIKMYDLVKKLARQISSDTTPLRLSYPDHKITWENPQTQSRPLYVRGIHSGEERKKIEFLENEDIRGLRYLVLDDSNFPSSGLWGDLLWLRLCKTLNSIPASLSLRSARVMEFEDIRHEDLDKIFDFGDEPPSQLRELTIYFPKHGGNRRRRRRRGGIFPKLHSVFGKALKRRRRVTFPELHSVFGKALKRSRRKRRGIFPKLHGVLGEASNSGFDKQKTDSSLTISLSTSGLHHSLNRWFEELKLTFLNKLVLKNVESLVSLPINFEELGNLRHLDLSGCCDLEVLPDSFTKLLHLQYLALADCRKLSIKDLGKISTLEYLDFEGCWLLEQLPRGTTAQRSLRYLNLLDTALLEVPEALAELENLEQLLIGSPKFTVLPISFKNLNRLTHLTLAAYFACFSGEEFDNFNRGLHNLPNLERLQVCIFWERDSFSRLPGGVTEMISRGLYNLANLKSIQIGNDFFLEMDRGSHV